MDDAAEDASSLVDIAAAIDACGSAVLHLALCRTGCQADAEDVFQTVFLRLYQKAPAVESDEHLKAWLLRVTANCCNDLYRTARKHRQVALDEAIAVEAASGLPDDAQAFKNTSQFSKLVLRNEDGRCLTLNAPMLYSDWWGHDRASEGFETRTALSAGEKRRMTQVFAAPAGYLHDSGLLFVVYDSFTSVPPNENYHAFAIGSLG